MRKNIPQTDKNYLQRKAKTKQEEIDHKQLKEKLEHLGLDDIDVIDQLYHATKELGLWKNEKE